MKMSNRQIDWYNAERRFIWACENAADKKKWMDQLNTNIVKAKIATGFASMMKQGISARKSETKKF
jgi:hypothetical protein